MAWNQKIIESNQTSNSPYFTPAFIDTACANCATHSTGPAAWSTECDICKTLTVSTTEIITYQYFDFLYLIFKITMAFVIIFLIAKKRK